MSESQKSSGTFIALLSVFVSNAVIVYGVFYLQWNFFMVLYSYWFTELIVTIFEKIKIRTLRRRNEIATASNKDPKTLLLFIYWVFIVVIAGFVTAPEKMYGENLRTIFFMNEAFNINILFVLLSETVLYYRTFYLDQKYDAKEIEGKSDKLSVRTTVMHLSIIFGTFAWFSMHTDKFFFHISPGKYGDFVFMLVFVAIKITGELVNLRKKK